MSAVATPGSTPAEAGRERRRMPGAEGMWVLVAGDLAIFSLLFLSFALDRRDDPVVFEQGRQALHLDQGGINTIVLLLGSWFVVRALRAIRTGDVDRAGRWLLGGVGAGVAFGVSKAIEYVREVDAGHTSTTSDFFMYYFSITGLHLVHVLIGTAILAGFLWSWRRRGRAGNVVAFESAAIYWHLVDLLWIVIFPLLYVVR